MCDDGSTDETEDRMRDWEQRDERVHYLRRPRNSGMPAITRNLGIEHARGDLIAFLDDDDEWLPGKLAAQQVAMAMGDAEVISTNALRSDGSLFYPYAPPIGRPTRADLMWTCPIIMSSALVPRDWLISAGGFRTSPKVRGVEDYAMWLELTSQGARLLTLGEPLVRYDDASTDRLSAARMRNQIAVARLNWAHILRPPAELASLKGTLRHSVAIAVMGMQMASTRARRRLNAGVR